jgi:hypothetical protein
MGERRTDGGRVGHGTGATTTVHAIDGDIEVPAVRIEVVADEVPVEPATVPATVDQRPSINGPDGLFTDPSEAGKRSAAKRRLHRRLLGRLTNWLGGVGGKDIDADAFAAHEREVRRLVGQDIESYMATHDGAEPSPDQLKIFDTVNRQKIVERLQLAQGDLAASVRTGDSMRQNVLAGRIVSGDASRDREQESEQESPRTTLEVQGADGSWTPARGAIPIGAVVRSEVFSQLLGRNLDGSPTADALARAAEAAERADYAGVVAARASDPEPTELPPVAEAELE